MDDKTISSAEESLAIIESMIEQSKRKMADNSFLFLIWGWLLFAATISQFVLKVMLNFEYHYYIWGVMYLTLVVLLYPIRQKLSRRLTETYTDRLVQYLLAGIILFSVLLILVFFRIGWDHCYTFFILLMALGCFLAAKILDLPVLITASVCCCCLTIWTTFLNFDKSILVASMAILVSYIIPGYLMRSKYKSNV